MNGWAKAALTMGVLLLGGWWLAWQGVVFAMAAIVGALVWEMVKLARLMKQAGAASPGRVADAQALHDQLREGLRLEELLALAGSLGQRVPGPAKAYVWEDGCGRQLVVELVKGRVSAWRWAGARPSGGPAS